jgi:transposase-like protein
MVQRGQQTTLAERIEIGERWEAGQTDVEIAQAVGHSFWTIRKWRRKYQHEGREGLASHIGRPAGGALSQYPSHIRNAIRQMREENSGWGPLTILTELERDSRFTGQRLPSRSRIAAFLKQEDLTRSYERHSDLSQAEAERAKKPHEQWEMDAKGTIQVPDLGAVTLINITDLFSRLKVDSLPCVHTSHPNTADYQLVLRRAFLQYGLPLRISLDHDSVFFDNVCPSPFPTMLHLWLIALGIEVRFIEQPPPAEHSVIERTHQTITQQAIAGRTFRDQASLQKRLTERLAFLNLHFPCRSLGGRAPLMVYPEARHSGQTYRLEWEETMLDLQRIYDYLSLGRWFRRTGSLGQISLGAQRYGLGKDFREQMLEITFNSQTREFVCLPANACTEIRLPIRGLTTSDLMGELHPLDTLPAYQLALPFSRSAWRQMELGDSLTGTTL